MRKKPLGIPTEESEFDLEKWQLQFNKLVGSDLQASRSWRTLTDAGVDGDSLSGLLALSCDFDGSLGYQALAWIRTQGLKHAKETGSLAKKLDEDRHSLIELFNDSLEPGFKEQLGKVVEDLQSSSKDSRRLFSRRQLNPILFLALLANEIQEKTRRACYREIATLVEIAHVTHGQPLPLIGEDALRKTLSRFKKRNPNAVMLDKASQQKILIPLIFLFLIHLVTSAAKSTSTGREKTP